MQILSKLISREHLTFEEAEQSLDIILHDGGAPEQIAAFLVLLAAKGVAVPNIICVSSWVHAATYATRSKTC